MSCFIISIYGFKVTTSCITPQSTDVKSSEKPEEKESSISDDEPPKLQSINTVGQV